MKLKSDNVFYGVLQMDFNLTQFIFDYKKCKHWVHADHLLIL